MEKIQINGIRKQPLKKNQILNLVQFAFNELKISFSYIEISFISDKMIKNYNKTYLNHDYATDIITFDYSKNQKEINAELLISAETALSNSTQFNTDYGSEIVRLISHGILHLAGYKDKTETQKKVMRKKENELINKFYKSIN